MANQRIAGFKSQGIIIATMMALGSTMAMASAATAVTLQVSIENLSPTRGAYFSPVWFSFHDGSFDLFDLNSSASSGIQYLAYTGFTGFEASVPGFIDVFKNFNPGFDGTYPPSNVADSLLSSVFIQSSAGSNGGVQDIIFTDDFSITLPGNFSPSKTAKKTITLNSSSTSHRYFSYAAKVIPSDDAFISNDDPIEIFDSNGNFIGADFIVMGNQVLDAGVEVNNEIPRLDFLRYSFGVDENGTIQIHPGLKPVGAGGLLDITPRGQQIFANADFKAPGYQVARITITQVPESVPEPATTTGLFALGGLFMLRRRVRQGR